MSVVLFDCESNGRPVRTYSRNNFVGSGFENVYCTVLCALVLDLNSKDRANETTISKARRITCWRTDNDGVDSFEAAFEQFDACDVIVAYNGIEFDMPLLFKHYQANANGLNRYRSHLRKLFDPFAVLRTATGRWFKLDDLLRLNGLQTKSANGAEAVAMWNSGDYARLQSYCMDDVVALTRFALLGGEDIQLPSVTNNTVPVSFPATYVNVQDVLAARENAKRRRTAVSEVAQVAVGTSSHDDEAES